ncbi:MAG: matrixin family metalloprotease, partial [Zetaproteobacteria bacterium]|nr:matrixin family metalloprotease [Zetaproteobacteria bacterium]
MRSIVSKYITLVTIVLMAFFQFVACGAQMYQVSLEEDHDVEMVPAGSTDPASDRYGLHSMEGWRELPIHIRVGQKITPEQEEGLLRALAIWEQAVGKKLFVYDGKDDTTGDTFKDLYSSLGDEVNGQYLNESWEKTKKSRAVLATTVWDVGPTNQDEIVAADIHFNGEYYAIGDAYEMMYDETDNRELVDMTTLSLHEAGHLLGLTHVSSEYDPDSIMNPNLFIGEGMAN